MLSLQACRELKIIAELQIKARLGLGVALRRSQLLLNKFILGICTKTLALQWWTGRGGNGWEDSSAARNRLLLWRTAGQFPAPTAGRIAAPGESPALVCMHTYT